MPQSGLNSRVKTIPPNDHFDTKAEVNHELNSQALRLFKELNKHLPNLVI